MKKLWKLFLKRGYFLISFKPHLKRAIKISFKGDLAVYCCRCYRLLILIKQGKEERERQRGTLEEAREDRIQ